MGAKKRLVLGAALGALGSIRNRIAHVRQVQISKDDVQAIVNVKFYAELMRAGGVIDFSKAEPLDVVLNFAQWAASTLHSGTDPANEKWTAAFDPKVPVPGFEAFLPKHPREGFGGVGRPGMYGWPAQPVRHAWAMTCLICASVSRFFMSSSRAFRSSPAQAQPLESPCKLSLPDADESTSGSQELDNERTVI